MGVPKVFHLGKLAYFYYYTRSAYLIGILILFNFNDLRSIFLSLCLSFQLEIKVILRTFLPPFQAPKYTLGFVDFSFSHLQKSR